MFDGVQNVSLKAIALSLTKIVVVKVILKKLQFSILKIP